jgi:N-formylglutamate deformylase
MIKNCFQGKTSFSFSKMALCLLWHNIFHRLRMIGLEESINAYSSPLLATAIHDGHDIREGIGNYLNIDEYDRLREEDPCTGFFTDVSESRIVVNTSRFEVDVNRPRDAAVYRTPEQAWGLNVWKDDVPVSVWEYSLGEYDFFYSRLQRILNRITGYWGYVIVYDIHSYNYRRKGKDEEEDNPAENPDINIGTGSMDRQLWGHVVESFMSSLDSSGYTEKKLHVAENIRFRGGHLAQWIHSNYPGKSCVLSIEFKKFFMDEWTGAVDIKMINGLKNALKATIPAVLEAAKVTALQQG